MGVDENYWMTELLEGIFIGAGALELLFLLKIFSFTTTKATPEH